MDLRGEDHAIRFQVSPDVGGGEGAHNGGRAQEEEDGARRQQGNLAGYAVLHAWLYAVLVLDSGLEVAVACPVEDAGGGVRGAGDGRIVGNGGEERVYYGAR